MNVSGTRGKRQTFQHGDDVLSITELLRKPEVVGYLEKDGPLTYASQREKLRRLLRSGRINQQLVMEHTARNPPQPPRVQDTRYGTRRRRANLPRTTVKGKVLFGTEPPLKSTQETTQRFRHQRGKPNGPPSIGAVSPTP